MTTHLPLSDSVKTALATNPDIIWIHIDQRGRAECWPWHGWIHKGYGRIVVADQRPKAHRLAYFLYYGTEPEVVRHTCDNTLCCNPAHLIGGTQLDNVRDREERGRTARGEANGYVKLTETAVLDIRYRAAAGESYESIGATYSIIGATVGAVARGITWKHVGGPITRRYSERIDKRR